MVVLRACASPCEGAAVLVWMRGWGVEVAVDGLGGEVALLAAEAAFRLCCPAVAEAGCSSA